MINALITAIRTLTIISVPGKDAPNLSKSLIFFPVIGVFFGCIVFGIYYLSSFFSFHYWGIVSAISLLVITVLTGALHVDGIGDVADAFGGGKSKEDILRILKDTQMGAFGITAIVFDILIKWLLWRIFFIEGSVHVIISSLVMGRCFQAQLIMLLPNARQDGIAASFAKKTKPIQIGVITSFILTLAYLTLLFSWYNVTIFLISALIIAVAFGTMCNKRINGITGDCVGAVNELVELAVLFSGLIIIY